MATPRKRLAPAKVTKRTTAQLARADAFCTALFVLITASFGQLSKDLAPVLGMSPGGASLALVILLLVPMGLLCEWLGGALFNPANNAFLYAMGRGTAREHSLRAVAQAFGGVTGALLALSLLPAPWTKNLRGMALGLRQGTTLLEGAGCEFVLGALVSFVVLYSGELESRILKLWLPLFATVLAVKAGEGVSGPSLNPAYTFAWVFVYPEQSVSEHFLVFWVAPIAAGLFGGWAFLGWQQFKAGSGQQQRRAKAD